VEDPIRRVQTAQVLEQARHEPVRDAAVQVGERRGDREIVRLAVAVRATLAAAAVIAASRSRTSPNAAAASKRTKGRRYQDPSLLDLPALPFGGIFCLLRRQVAHVIRQRRRVVVVLRRIVLTGQPREVEEGCSVETNY
jgi:hypothetical protein